MYCLEMCLNVSFISVVINCEFLKGTMAVQHCIVGVEWQDTMSEYEV